MTLQHLIGIEALKTEQIDAILNRAQEIHEAKQIAEKFPNKILINMFFENSTRTQSSFEIAGHRLGLNVINMSMATSSLKKGETLLDTAATLNAMRPDIISIRHSGAGSVALLASKMDCAVLNAGDGRHEHPTQALLDALTIRRRIGKISGLTIAICGDVLHSRVARSNIFLLQKFGNNIRLIGPKTLIPKSFADMGCEIFYDMQQGLKDADVIIMLRLQKERMQGGFIPSEREYFHKFGLDHQKLQFAKESTIVLHPGPINRGVEIDSNLADDVERSAIQDQVNHGVSVRMAVIETLLKNRASQ